MYLVECYNDGTVLLTLGLPGKLVRRMYGKGNVIVKLRQYRDGSLTCMMDLDRQRSGLQGLKDLALVRQDHYLHLYQWKDHRVIMVDDCIEDWLVRMTTLTGKRMADFGLPEDPRAIHRRERKEMDPKIVSVVRHLEQADSPGIRTLKEFLGI